MHVETTSMGQISLGWGGLNYSEGILFKTIVIDINVA